MFQLASEELGRKSPLREKSGLHPAEDVGIGSELSVPVETYTKMCMFWSASAPHARRSRQPCPLLFHCCGSLEDLSGFPSARWDWGVLSTKASKPCGGGNNIPVFSSFLCLEAQPWTGTCPEYEWKLKSCILFCPAVCRSRGRKGTCTGAPMEVALYLPSCCSPEGLARSQGSWLPKEAGCMSLSLLYTQYKQAIKTS